MSVPFTAPAYGLKAFNCPHCGAFANQSLRDLTYASPMGTIVQGLKISTCSHCHEHVIWLDEAVLWPSGGGIPPHSDLPEDLKDDYLEAKDIAGRSPRGAAALLRLVIQKLCKELGATGNLDHAIGELVKRGLPQNIQQALDVVRVVGNNAVHPGELDLRDDTAAVNALFDLVNLITEIMIAQPKRVQALYDALPEGARDAIEKRDQ